MVGRQADLVVLSDADRSFLESQVRRHKAPRSLSDRCRMILLCAQGLQSKEVAERLGVHEHTVGKWRRRFVEDGIEGLTDEYRAGRPRTVSDAQVAEVVERTLNTTPKDATHWSIRSMAADRGLSHTTIRRIWTAFGLQPHRAETFKLSSDPLFVDKVQDIVGLYMSPPDRAIVLCVDEKSQIQALDREQPVLPMAPGVAERRTHIVDAGGGTLMPGFVESQVHLFSGAYGQTLLQLAPITGFDAMKAAVQAFSAERPAEGLLFAQGADYEILGPKTRLDRHVLDAMCPDRPLAVMAYDFHTLFANTPALVAAGLLQGRELPVGNEVVMGADGLATGELREKFALLPVLDLRTSGGREMLGMSGIEPPVKPTSTEWREDMEILKAGMRFAASKGITSMHNMDGNRHLLELLRDVETEDGLLARISVPFHFTREMTLSEFDRASAMTADFTGDNLTCGRVKIFVDGVIESGTAAMLEDYADRPGLKGAPIFDDASFREAAIEADRRGLQITVHAIGDAAVRIALDGYAAARVTNGPRDGRHRIEHIEMIDPVDVPRFAELGVVASFQPLHAPSGESATTRSIGPARASFAYAWRSLYDAGATIAFSSDWPIVPIDPLLGIQTALTRKPHLPGLPDQRLPLHEVLAAFTSNGAFAGHMEGKTGILRPGMLADLVLLSGDIESTPVEEIAALGIRMTVCDGRITYAV